MKVILCTDCGHVMSRYTNKCFKCKRTNLAFYDRESPKLESEIKRIAGKGGPSSPLVSMFYVLILIVSVYGIYYAWNIYLGNITVSFEPPKILRSAAKPGGLTK